MNNPGHHTCLESTLHLTYIHLLKEPGTTLSYLHVVSRLCSLFIGPLCQLIQYYLSFEPAFLVQLVKIY